MALNPIQQVILTCLLGPEDKTAFAREKARLRQVRYRAKNPRACKESVARYRAKNLQTIKESKARWRAKNPERLRKYSLKKNYGAFNCGASNNAGQTIWPLCDL